MARQAVPQAVDAGLSRRAFLSAPLTPRAMQAEAVPPLIPAPARSDEWPAWRERLRAWREETKAQLGYRGELYDQPALEWTQKNFACYFLLLWDERFWDYRAARFRVEEFLHEPGGEHGGFDSVVLWHAYPRIGFDERNQFDFYRDMPGGIRGVRDLCRRFRARGVRAFVDYNPWDTGTRREGRDDLEILVWLVKETEADGIFLDTLAQGARDFRPRLERARAGVALESELALPVEAIEDHASSWAQRFKDSPAPGVLRNKWFERRHLLHAIDRWNRDHSDEIHSAWMNGSGSLIWENIFGQWVETSERDKSLRRAMLPVQRRYAKLFCGEGWMPLVGTLKEGVYASLWEDGQTRLWTLVNRTRTSVSGELMRIERRAGTRLYDLMAGRQCERAAGEIGPRGIGCFLETAAKVDGLKRCEFAASTESPVPKETLRPVPDVVRLAEVSEGMVRVPGGVFHVKAVFRERECGTYQTPLERDVELGAFAIDRAPVSNAQYLRFLRDSGYRPKYRENFLAHWRNSRPPAGGDNAPVVFVDLDDARAYARWAGRRLPTEEEWTYAAATAAGLEGMRGVVWHWTESERSDGRTRFSILKGGCAWEAKGSHWYADGGPRPAEFCAKFIHMWPGLDRCSTIGFRTVAPLDRPR